MHHKCCGLFHSLNFLSKLNLFMMPNTEDKPGTEPRGGGGDYMPNEGTQQVHIPGSMLPKGMKVNKGDILEFKCTGEMDEDGDYPCEYNHGDGEGDDWASGLRHEMSPRNGDGGGY
jgi:hypothetical protein